MRNEDCILGVPTGREEGKRKAYTQNYRGEGGEQRPKDPSFRKPRVETVSRRTGAVHQTARKPGRKEQN